MWNIIYRRFQHEPQIIQLVVSMESHSIDYVHQDISCLKHCDIFKIIYSVWQGKRGMVASEVDSRKDIGKFSLAILMNRKPARDLEGSIDTVGSASRSRPCVL